MMRDVGGVRKSIHQSWLTKGLGLGLLCWGFKTLKLYLHLTELLHMTAWIVCNGNVFDN